MSTIGPHRGLASERPFAEGAILTLNGRPHAITRGGHDGFRWLEHPSAPALVPGDTLTVRVAPDPKSPKAAFISQAHLTSP